MQYDKCYYRGSTGCPGWHIVGYQGTKYFLVLKPLDVSRYAKCTLRSKREELGVRNPWYVLKNIYWIYKWINAEAFSQGKGSVLGSQWQCLELGPVLYNGLAQNTAAQWMWSSWVRLRLPLHPCRVKDLTSTATNGKSVSHLYPSLEVRVYRADPSSSPIVQQLGETAGCIHNWITPNSPNVFFLHFTEFTLTFDFPKTKMTWNPKKDPFSE